MYFLSCEASLYLCVRLSDINSISLNQSNQRQNSGQIQSNFAIYSDFPNIQWKDYKGNNSKEQFIDKFDHHFCHESTKQS